MTNPTCTVIVSAPGEPIRHCGERAKHAVFTSAPRRSERLDTFACGEDHLAQELRLIALYEVCDFRVQRYYR